MVEIPCKGLVRGDESDYVGEPFLVISILKHGCIYTERLSSVLRAATETSNQTDDNIEDINLQKSGSGSIEISDVTDQVSYTIIRLAAPIPYFFKARSDEPASDDSNLLPGVDSVFLRGSVQPNGIVLHDRRFWLQG